MKWLRLRVPAGQFFDAALGFGLVRDQRKPRPKSIPVGGLLHQALKSGAIIECGPPAPEAADDPAVGADPRVRPPEPAPEAEATTVPTEAEPAEKPKRAARKRGSKKDAK